MAEEHNFYTAGNTLIEIEFNGWKIRPMVCYDLRFPVWARNLTANGIFAYDILLYVANWPQARINVWDTLLKARALENHAYCIGVNRYGKDEKSIFYNGHSSVYNTKGEQLFFSESEGIYMISLKKEPLDKYRKKFPAYLDADSFKIE
jgi:predicted amidohydrolase